MLTGTRVLVVEDEAIIAMMLEEYLALLGCEVVATATRLEAAKEKARIAAIDVAVLDINLAGQNSYPVADILSARGIPFIFATGYGSINLLPKLQNFVVLSKPFSMDQLADALRSARKMH